MVNSIYYTFSTIAQTLAGAIGLLGAFVLFRLQALNNDIDERGGQIASVLRSVTDPTKVRQLLHQRDFRQLLQILGDAKIPPGVYQPTWEQARLPILLDSRDRLVRLFAIAFFLTLGLIMASVIALPYAVAIASSFVATWIVFAAGLLWLGACLTSYALLMLDALA